MDRLLIVSVWFGVTALAGCAVQVDDTEPGSSGVTSEGCDLTEEELADGFPKEELPPGHAHQPWERAANPEALKDSAAAVQAAARVRSWREELARIMREGRSLEDELRDCPHCDDVATGAHQPIAAGAAR